MINTLCDLLLDKLGERLEGRAYALLDWPDYLNPGDHAIWAGAQYLLSVRLGARCVYRSSEYTVDFNFLRSLPSSVVFVCTGGGNFGDLYPRHQQFREKLVSLFLDREIIFLPQSVYFQSDQNFELTARKLSRHKNLKIFVRDYDSFQILSSAISSEVIMASDTAFFLNDLIPYFLTSFTNFRSVERAFLMRGDSERLPELPPIPEGTVHLEWNGDFHYLGGDAEVVADELRKMLKLDEFFWHKEDRESWNHFFLALSVIAETKSLCTDRLHGAILGTMMGLDVVFLNNAFDKNKRFAEVWGAMLPSLRYRDNILDERDWFL